VTREASWRGGDERTLTLIKDEAGWRLSSQVLDLAASPRLLCRTLARAIRERDYDLLHDLLPAAEQKRWTPATLATALERPGIRENWAELAAALLRMEAPVISLEGGSRARVDIGTTALWLTRESEGWKIVDVVPTRPYTTPRTLTPGGSAPPSPREREEERPGS
jgi:hypothetical protein